MKDFDIMITRIIMDYTLTTIDKNPESPYEFIRKHENIIQEPFSIVTSKFNERIKKGDVKILVHDFNYSKLMENVNPDEYLQVITCLYHAFIIFVYRFYPGYEFYFVNEDREKNQFQIILGPREDLNKVISKEEDILIGTF